MFRLFCVFFVFFAGCWLCVCNLFRMLWQSVCNVVAICSPRICYPFRMHSRNVRNVFVICVLHIRHVKVWFLRCKSMVFVFWMLGCCNLFGMFWQSVRNILAIRQQHFGNPFAAKWQSVRSRRGPIYRAGIYIFTTHFVCVWLILKACYGSFAL